MPSLTFWIMLVFTSLFKKNFWDMKSTYNLKWFKLYLQYKHQKTLPLSALFHGSLLWNSTPSALISQFPITGEKWLRTDTVCTNIQWVFTQSFSWKLCLGQAGDTAVINANTEFDLLLEKRQANKLTPEVFPGTMNPKGLDFLFSPAEGFLLQKWVLQAK